MLLKEEHKLSFIKAIYVTTATWRLLTCPHAFCIHTLREDVIKIYYNVYSVYQYVTIYSFSDCPGTADIVFAVDTSGSVRPERFPDEKRFIKSVIDNLEVGQDKARIGVVTWSDSARVAFHLNQYMLKQVCGSVSVLDHTTFLSKNNLRHYQINHYSILRRASLDCGITIDGRT